MSGDTDGPPRGYTWLIAVAFSLYAFVASAISFSGWLFDLQRLADWDNDGIAILPNTTVAGMALSAGLVALLFGRRRYAICGASIAGLIGGMTFIEHALKVCFGIDGLLLLGRSWGTTATTTPGFDIRCCLTRHRRGG